MAPKSDEWSLEEFELAFLKLELNCAYNVFGTWSMEEFEAKIRRVRELRKILVDRENATVYAK